MFFYEHPLVGLSTSRVLSMSWVQVIEAALLWMRVFGLHQEETRFDLKQGNLPAHQKD